MIRAASSLPIDTSPPPPTNLLRHCPLSENKQKHRKAEMHLLLIKMWNYISTNLWNVCGDASPRRDRVLVGLGVESNGNLYHREDSLLPIAQVLWIMCQRIEGLYLVQCATYY